MNCKLYSWMMTIVLRFSQWNNPLCGHTYMAVGAHTPEQRPPPVRIYNHALFKVRLWLQFKDFFQVKIIFCYHSVFIIIPRQKKLKLPFPKQVLKISILRLFIINEFSNGLFFLETFPNNLFWKELNSFQIKLIGNFSKVKKQIAKQVINLNEMLFFRFWGALPNGLCEDSQLPNVGGRSLVQF